MSLEHHRRTAFDPLFLKVDARLHWPAWVLAAIGCAAVLTLGIAAALGQRYEVRAITVRLQDVAPRAKMETNVAPTTSRDFTLALPAVVPMGRIFSEAFKSAARSGLTVVSAEPQDVRRASPSELASTTLDLKVSGPYPAIKEFVGELLGRFPGLTLQHMRIHRAAGAVARRDAMPASQGQAIEIPIQEAVLTLRQWTRPTVPATATAVKARE